MPVNFARALSDGGKSLHDVLSFAVFSVRPDCLFVHLAKEYRLRPTAVGAVTLYDVFIAPGALARLSAESMLPPSNLSLQAALAPVRHGLEQALAPPPDPLPEDPPWEPPPVPLPANYLFAPLADRLLSDPDGQVAALSAAFDPDLGPLGSLPGGKLNAGQRHFAEQTWRRRIQPALVAAGFWRVATVGQP